MPKALLQSKKRSIIATYATTSPTLIFARYVPTRYAIKSVVCVVENISGVLSIENTGAFRGLYHVLGGVISPMDGVGPSDLEIDSLIDRVASGEVKEIIFALNPTMEGDTTIFFYSA